MEHIKHPKLARPALGRFGRNEFAILGTDCATIQRVSRQIMDGLADRFQCAYLDENHGGEGAILISNHHATSQPMRVDPKIGMFQIRPFFNESDFVLVNGNHHEAAAQVVVIDEKKENSLRKRLGQLTDVRLVLLAEGMEKPFDFLENALPGFSKITSLRLADVAGIVRFFEKEMQEKVPSVNGLVLAGGRSTRMGRDKSMIGWHGKPQREHLAEMMQPLCNQVFVSCRAGQETEFGAACPTLPDTFSDLGPFGAVLSAFRSAPNSAWLVVACDLPLLDRATLEFLLENRQPRRTATSFESPFDQMPEPLTAVWEPKSYATLLSFLGQGVSCLRKVLLNSDVLILKPPSPAALTNVNTPEDARKIKI